jgi:chromate transporter
MKKHGKRPAIVAFVDGVTAAAIGAIAGSVVVLARRSIVDGPTLAIALATAAILWKLKNAKEPVLIAAAAALGMLIHPLVRS